MALQVRWQRPGPSRAAWQHSGCPACSLRRQGCLTGQKRLLRAPATQRPCCLACRPVVALPRSMACLGCPCIPAGWESSRACRLAASWAGAASERCTQVGRMKCGMQRRGACAARGVLPRMRCGVDVPSTHPCAPRDFWHSCANPVPAGKWRGTTVAVKVRAAGCLRCVAVPRLLSGRVAMLQVVGAASAASIFTTAGWPLVLRACRLCPPAWAPTSEWTSASSRC